MNKYDLKTDALVGSTVKSIVINDDNTSVVIETDEGTYQLTWYGDYCASCFLAHVSGIDNLIGARIQSVEDSEWKDISPDAEYGDVTESMGTTIKTTKGWVTFETRLEHNGYYGGWIEVTRYDEPQKLKDYKELTKDF